MVLLFKTWIAFSNERSRLVHCISCSFPRYDDFRLSCLCFDENRPLSQVSVTWEYFPILRHKAVRMCHSDTANFRFRRKSGPIWTNLSENYIWPKISISSLLPNLLCCCYLPSRWGLTYSRSPSPFWHGLGPGMLVGYGKHTWLSLLMLAYYWGDDCAE